MSGLHPQNGRIPDRGLEREESHFRVPPVYVTKHGEAKYMTPVCPHVRGRPHRAWCREEALYAFGENWCKTCTQYCVDLTDHPFRDASWTDPRYRIEGGFA